MNNSCKSGSNAPISEGLAECVRDGRAQTGTGVNGGEESMGAEAREELSGAKSRAHQPAVSLKYGSN